MIFRCPTTPIIVSHLEYLLSPGAFHNLYQGLQIEVHWGCLNQLVNLWTLAASRQAAMYLVKRVEAVLGRLDVTILIPSLAIAPCGWLASAQSIDVDDIALSNGFGDLKVHHFLDST